MPYLLADETSASVNSASETTLVSYTGDGTKTLAGFFARGPVSAEYRLYVGSTRLLTYVTHTADQLAYVVLPKGVPIANGTTVYLKVYHTYGSAQTFYGSLLEGN